MELDHIYICTDKKAPIGDLLVEFGLKEGSSNIHPGQGTENRRFFFHNFMLELLWIEDRDEVQNELTKPMRLLERCELEKKNSSPFGIAFRLSCDENEIVPIPVWNYHPVYLPEHLKIQVAANTPLSEPMYLYLSFAKRQDKSIVGRREPMEHKLSLKEVTSIKIYINQEEVLSSAASVLNEFQNIEIIKDKEHLLELEFDKGLSKQSRDFRPNLPLIFKW